MNYFECFSVTKNDESTFFIQNIDCFYFCAKLGIAVHEWERETLSWVVPHSINSLSFVFPWYIWCKLNKLFKYNKYQLTKRWLEGNLDGFFGDSEENVAHRISNNYEISGFLSL